MADVLVSGIKISEMNLVNEVQGSEKVPTDQVGDKSVSIDQIATYVNNKVKPVWGNIQGDIDKQTDLMNMVNTKDEFIRFTLQTAIDDLQEQVNALGGGASYGYTSYAAMVADAANILPKSVVTVGGDLDRTKDGMYIYDGTKFSKLPYDPLQQSKNYTDTKVSNLQKLTLTNIDSTYFNISGYINSSGQLASSSTFKSTDFLPVIENRSYRILSQVAGVANYAWYDKNKVFISAFGTDQTTLVEKTYTSPVNAAYMRVCAYNTAAQAIAYIRADVYQIATTIGETGQAYPITNMSSKYQAMYPTGINSVGSQWISRRIKEKLTSQGIGVTTLNVGLGGQTSRWGKYWIDAVLSMSPKPTHCVVCFYINDNNSIAKPSNNTYDFDPNLMFSNKPETSGGVNGKISNYTEWETNVKFISDKLLANGIKPIIIMPSQTASATQAQAIRSGQLDRIASGFTVA